MFKFSNRKIKKQILEIEKRLAVENNLTKNMSFWKKFFKKQLISSVLKEKKIFYFFLHSFLLLKNKLLKKQKNNKLIEDYFFYSYFLTVKKLKIKYQDKLFSEIKKRAANNQNNMLNTLFQEKKINWSDKKIIFSEKLKYIESNIVSTEKACALGNFYTLLFIQNQKLFPKKCLLKRAYNFGYSLGMYITTHYEIWKNYKNKLKNKKNSEYKNKLFFVKLFFCENYIKELKYFFPLDFNNFVQEINYLIGK